MVLWMERMMLLLLVLLLLLQLLLLQHMMMVRRIRNLPENRRRTCRRCRLHRFRRGLRRCARHQRRRCRRCTGRRHRRRLRLALFLVLVQRRCDDALQTVLEVHHFRRLLHHFGSD